MILRVAPAQEALVLLVSKLLALDQSSRVTGWAVFDGSKLEAYGKIEYDSSTPIEDRLHGLRQQVKDLILAHGVNEVVMEDIQLQNNVVNNVQTFKTLAEVFGVLSELCVDLHIPQQAVLASSWKSVLGIKGKDRAAQKRNAQQWVIDTYEIKPIQDICDAICIGNYVIKNNPTEKGFDWS